MATQILPREEPDRPSIHVERHAGGSPTILMLHGWGDGAYVWSYIARALHPRFTVFLVDLRGHGDSEWDRTSRYHISGYVNDVARVIEHWSLQELIVVGHSLGGRIATHLCSRYASRVRASVLVDFAPQLDSQSVQEVARLLRESLRLYETAEQYVDWLRSTRPLTDEAVLDYIAGRALRPSDGGLRLKFDPALTGVPPTIEAGEAELLWSLLRHQSCPTLLVRGAASAVLRRGTASRVAEELPRGELAIVPAAGHAVMLDNPDGFQHVLLGFLGRVVGAAR